MVVFGTRPEAIKMCPLIKELRLRNDLETYVVVTGQHREMLKQVLDVFKIIPDYDLDIMRKQQSLFDVTTSILSTIKSVLDIIEPDLVLVHGDTTTTFVTTLACFYCKISVGHVEAGLRTNNLYSPFPEEFNRQAVSLIAKYHFAPTENAKNNLIIEGKDPKSIYVTGNTAIDALKTTIKKDYYHPLFDWLKEDDLILITAHRRENLGEPMENMFRAINRVIKENRKIKAIYPIHLNPAVRDVAKKIFEDNDRVKLIEPLEVVDFHNFMNKAHIILTDSGGIQEEAPSLGKPVLVMRDTTERPEGVKAGTLRLVGTSEESIYKNFSELLNSKETYNLMSKASNPYGDGTASEKIADIILNF
jgi:UDP-N-acetylglucosamine 2-epimerase (non-hydrolysing)